MLAYSDPSRAGLRVLAPDEVEALMSDLRRRFEALYGERLRGVYLFGSYARGDAGPESDVDVLIVLDELAGYMAEIRRTGGVVGELALARDVSVTTVFVSEMIWREAATPFLRNVHAEGRSAA